MLFVNWVSFDKPFDHSEPQSPIREVVVTRPTLKDRGSFGKMAHRAAYPVTDMRYLLSNSASLLASPS